MHTLITGGAGFVGSHLADALLAAGDRVTILDDLSTGRRENLKGALSTERCRLVVGTVRDEEVLEPLVGACDRVFHLAAAVGVSLIVDRPVHTVETNVYGSEVVLRAAMRHAKPMLLASSSEIYGKSTSIPFCEDDDVLYGNTTLSRWSYAVSKSTSEFLALAHYRTSGLAVVIARLFNTVGPRQSGTYGMVVPRFVESALRDEPLRVFGDGEQVRCFADVADVVRALIGLMDEPAAFGRVFNVGADVPISIEQLARRVIALTGSGSEIERVPYDEAYAPGFEDMRVRQPSLERIREAIGYEPSLTLDDTLRRIVAWKRDATASVSEPPESPPMADEQPAEASKRAPTLSVVVPVYNSHRELKRCLGGLAASTYDDFDVLVVDDGSIDPVAPLVEKYGFRCLRIAGPKGPGRARNHGVREVRGESVVFVDADVCVHPDTLALIAETLANHPECAAVVGTYDNAPEDPGFVSQYKNLFHHYMHRRWSGPINTFWAGCGAIRREVFLEHGGFDEERYQRPKIEDIELGLRLAAGRRRVLLDERVQGTHLKRWTLWTMVKTDVFDRGIPWMELMLESGRIEDTLNVSWLQRASVAAVYLMLVSLLAAPWIPGMWLVAVALAVVLLALNFDLYRYLARCRGVVFAIRAVPLHWFYFLYCGVSVVAAVLIRMRGRAQSQQAHDDGGRVPVSGEPPA